MDLVRLYDKDGADQAVGTAVVVDVFRAAATAAYILAGGAQYIIPIADAAEAFALREQYPDYLLLGEDRGFKLDGFDYGNSPYDISQVNLNDRVVVQRTSQGTQGLVRCVQADQVYFGGFPTFSATAQSITQNSPRRISIIAMDGPGSEDDVYANALELALRGDVIHWDEIQDKLTHHPAAKRFLDPSLHLFPRTDYDYCTGVDRLGFSVILQRTTDGLRLNKRDVPL